MSNAVNGVYTEGRYNAVLNDDDALANLPPLVALQFLGFAFSEQGENSLRVTNERLNRIREELDEVNNAIAVIQANSDTEEGGSISPSHPEYENVKAVLDRYGIDYQTVNPQAEGMFGTFSEAAVAAGEWEEGAILIPKNETWTDQLQTETTSLSNDLQRLITQAQSEGSRVEQGNSFGESARQTSDTVVDVLLGRA